MSIMEKLTVHNNDSADSFIAFQMGLKFSYLKKVSVLIL